MCVTNFQKKEKETFSSERRPYTVLKLTFTPQIQPKIKKKCVFYVYLHEIVSFNTKKHKHDNSEMF
jgi:hypothetical protein